MSAIAEQQTGIAVVPFDVVAKWVRVSILVPEEQAQHIEDLNEFWREEFSSGAYRVVEESIALLRAGAQLGLAIIPSDPVMNWIEENVPLFEDLESEPMQSVDLEFELSDWEDITFMADCMGIAPETVLRAAIHEAHCQEKDREKRSTARKKRDATIAAKKGGKAS